MITLPRMAMIGASGRDVGKTLFSGLLIARTSRRHPVVAIKATSAKKPHCDAVRAEDQAGVRSFSRDRFWIWEEAETASDKDTSRLLAAGAIHSYWLCHWQGHAEQGLAALVEMIEPSSAIVCESNSLREVVEPGLFLLIQRTGAAGAKPSFERLKPRADRIVTFDGEGFDLDVENVDFFGGRWTIR